MLKPELQTWRVLHQLLEARSAFLIEPPDWFEDASRMVSDSDIRIRRYFPAFITACKVIAVVRSFGRSRNSAAMRDRKILVDFEDFAIATIVFEPAFAESLHRASDKAMETRVTIETLVRRNKGKPVGRAELAQELGISKDQAYRKLSMAVQAGAIFRANVPEKGNEKLYLPSARPRFLPDIDEVFEKLPAVGDHARFINPFNGEWIYFDRGTKRNEF
jgi:hypothetical protein